MCRAQEILRVIVKVFNDVATGMHSSEPSPLEENGYDFDKEFLDEWNEFLQDHDLFEMIVDNLSLSLDTITSHEFSEFICYELRSIISLHAVLASHVWQRPFLVPQLFCWQL